MNTQNRHFSHTTGRRGSGCSLRMVWAYRIPILVLTMISCFAIGYTWYLLMAARAFRCLVRTSSVVDSDAFLLRWRLYRVLTVLYLIVGDLFFFMLHWSFLRALFTAAGYVPRDPWQHPPLCDPIEQRRVSEQWAKQRQWLRQNQQAMAAAFLQQKALVRQQMNDVSVPISIDPQPPVPLGGPPVFPSAPNQQQQQQSESSLAAAAPHGGTPGLNPFEVSELEADGSLRYCGPCGVYRPDRSHHCRHCDRCVACQDHMCRFFFRCIGLLNYKYFFLTVSYGTLCGWACSAAFLHVAFLVRETVPPSGGVAAYACAAAGSATSGTGSSGAHSLWWLAVPALMLAVNVPVFILWRFHIDLLRRGIGTIERLRQIQVEHFLRSMNVGRYGRWPPETSRLCARLAEAREKARCLIYHGGSGGGSGASARDDEEEYARMLQRESDERLEAEERRAALEAAEEQRVRNLRRLFGRPQRRWHHLAPFAPRNTGILPGEIEATAGDAKAV